MRFTYFKSARAQHGQLCTYELFEEVTNSLQMLATCQAIADAKDDDERSELKKSLPVVTWQAEFEGKRLASEAKPSGLFMLDIDHVDNPYQLYSEKVACRIKELGIVFVGKTASTHGLRIVALCREGLSSIEECQRWLASNLKVEYDGVCKDWARCSFLVHSSYTYYMNAKAIWQEEATPQMLYSTERKPFTENKEMEKKLDEAVKDAPVDQREGLFGGTDEYQGIKLSDIAKEWLIQTGGEPERGMRNTRIYKLALRMRYLCDFNEANLLRVLPSYGLPEDEMQQIAHSAISTSRAADIPMDMQHVIENINRRRALGETSEEIPEIITNTDKMPPLPPIIREFVENAPDDFKAAVVMCQLPILGALGSRLRAQYLDGIMHSPTFLVSLEAPQASGKSFMARLVNYELAQMMEHDEEQRAKEREYESKVREMKLLNIKVTKENKDEVIGSRPKTLIRYVPATMSITKLLMRMNDAQGLHLFAFAPEIDTVTKAFKRAFSSFSDLLRVGFDNGLYGQDYASENSFSGIIPIYYNMLSSGTPKAMRRFYPDVEDGLVSRVCFVTLPDQFGKPMPVWRELDRKQKAIVDRALVDLNEISIVGDEVQPEHEMRLNWLNKELENWIKAQQVEAVKENDRTRDIFCRRSAVVAFRAGMLAYFLYGEKRTPTIMRNVKRFAVWIANMMLNQHLLRFNISQAQSNTTPYAKAFASLKDTFTREEAQAALVAAGDETQVKQALYKWKLAGLIKEVEKDKNKHITFKKISNE